MPRNAVRAVLKEHGNEDMVGTDVCGLAIGADGFLVLYKDRVEGVSLEGRPLWTAPLALPPVRWGVALAGRQFVATLSTGLVVCFGE